MFKIEVNWKEFNVNLDMLDKDLRALYPSYVGNQAHNHLELWFKDQPSQADQDAIKAFWDGLLISSPEAVGYQSAAQVQVAADKIKASGLAKLKVLGLTDAEIAALVG